MIIGTLKMHASFLSVVSLGMVLVSHKESPPYEDDMSRMPWQASCALARLLRIGKRRCSPCLDEDDLQQGRITTFGRAITQCFCHHFSRRIYRRLVSETLPRSRCLMSDSRCDCVLRAPRSWSYVVA